MGIEIEELYPDATPEQRAEAERRLEAYARLVLRVYDHQQQLKKDQEVDQMERRL